MRKTATSATLLFASCLLLGNAFADAPRQPMYGDMSPDGQYVYRGLETGWELAPHRYERKGGRWVHTDSLDHTTVKPDSGARVSPRMAEASPTDE